jgi:kynureninase
MTTSAFDCHEDHARALDAADTLAPLAAAFEFPRDAAGKPARYLCGHSLGLMPRAARARVEHELERWARRAVAGHFDADGGWYAFHERFAAPLARLLGAEATEVVAMNALTVNLHLMLVSFFRPSGARRRILIERGAFPSDRFAVQSQLGFHGLDPDRDLIELGQADGRSIDAAALDRALAEADGSVALVLLPGVQYLSGEALDLAGCAAVARRHGCRIGFDLAHAIGNLALELRAAEPDFAVWCGYKYLNGGPGAIGGCFVNRRWIGDDTVPRFAGWWGHDKTRRFAPAQSFAPIPTAEAWQLSNPPILAMAPLAASLELFEQAGMGNLRHKSAALSSYLVNLLEHLCGDHIDIITPHAPEARGAQISLKLSRAELAQPAVDRLAAAGIVIDWRPPDVLRLAPVPLYNSFSDVHACATALARALST